MPAGKRGRSSLAFILFLVVPCLVSAQEAADEIEYARQLPGAAKQHVYLFFLNGIDPLGFGNLRGLRNFCRDLGFARSWYGQFYHRWYFQRVIAEIRQRDSEARLVIVGFSAGALAARDLAQALNRENIPVELLVYIEGATLTNSPHNRPENVRRLIHIRANDPILRGWAIEGADNVKCQDVWHFGTPMHTETRRRIAATLAEVAGQIPVVQPPPSIWPPLDEKTRTANQSEIPSDKQLRLTSQSESPPEPADFSTVSHTLAAQLEPVPISHFRHLSPSKPGCAKPQLALSDGTIQAAQRSSAVPGRDERTWKFLRATRELRFVPPPDYSGLPYQPLRSEP